MRTSTPRPNRRNVSRLRLLPYEQRRQLDEWLLSALTYSEIKDQLASRFGVKTTVGSLSSYYSKQLSQLQSPRAEVRDLHTSEGTIEFEIVTHVVIRRTDLAQLMRPPTAAPHQSNTQPEQ